MKKIIFLNFLTIAFVLSACSDSNIEAVKKGVLEFDKTLTVGEAIDNYKYCDEKPSWKSFVSENGRDMVQASCDMNKAFRQYLVHAAETSGIQLEKTQKEQKDKIKKLKQDIDESNLQIKESHNKIPNTKKEMSNLESELKKLENELTKIKSEYANIKKIKDIHENQKAWTKNHEKEEEKRREIYHKFQTLQDMKLKINDYKNIIKHRNEDIEKTKALIKEIEQNIQDIKIKTDKEASFISKAKMKLTIQFAILKSGGFEVRYAGLERNYPENIDKMHQVTLPYRQNALQMVYANIF